MDMALPSFARDSMDNSESTVIETITSPPIAVLFGETPIPGEIEKARRAVTNDRVLGGDGSPAELLGLGLVGEPSRTLYHSPDIDAVVWTSGEVPSNWKDSNIRVPHERV